MSRETAKKWFNALVILVCLFLLGFGALKAVVVFGLVLICDYLNYGTRWLYRAGFGLLVLTTLVFADVVPEPQAWRGLAQDAWNAFRQR